jgi:uncharacterized damage-inducible protein DinB
MSRPLLEDAFAHHVWATLTLIDACLPLNPDQLAAGAPGTYGSIVETMRHLVGSDASYLAVLTNGRVLRIDEDGMDLAALRAEMERHAPAWSSLLAENPDADTILVRRRDDGSEAHAPVGIRIAQALQHGTDHRSQICTGLTTLGIEPPSIDVWDYAVHVGRLVEVAPAH